MIKIIMKILKITGITFGSIILIIIVFWFLVTVPVRQESFYTEDYYRKSCVAIDSLAKQVHLSNAPLYAGFSRVNITPVLNALADDPEKGAFMRLPLAGYGDRKGLPATGVHDSIFIKAAALKSGNLRIILVGADLLIIPPNITDSLINILSEKGISRDQIYLSATHTHSGPGAWGPGFTGTQFAGKENPLVQQWLTRKIADAIFLALDDLKPASAGTSEFDAAPYTRNRLIGDKGTKNDKFSFIQIEQKEGKKAVIGSFAAHSTTLGDDNMEISGDYPGYWQRKMEKETVDLALFMAGSMGSQTGNSKGEKFEKSAFLGEVLADSSQVYLQNTVMTDSLEMAAITIPLHLPPYHFRISTKRSLSTAMSKKLMPLPENAALQAFRLGKTIWVTTPADFSGEFALQLKNELAARGFLANVTSFNGSYTGYIIPGRYFYLDEYESKTMGFFGPAMGDYTYDLIRQITSLLSGKFIDE